MFPADLDGLFTKTIGEETNRILSLRDNKKFSVTISCVGSDKYDLLVIDIATNETFLRRTRLQESVIQLNWTNFREGGFQKMS